MEASHPEPKSHTNTTTSKLNSLRAAVLGANDGIVSVAGIVVGVAGATSSRSSIFTAGLAGLVAGAFSMAAGEYVSVSSQRDTEREMLNKEKIELRDYPKEELQELQELYEAKGLSEKTAKAVAVELTAKDVFAAHADAELGIDPNALTNPWQAAIASAVSFLVGAIIPLMAILVFPTHLRVLLTFISVLLALTLTGLLSAKASEANRLKATFRVVIGGALAMAATYSIGKLVGASGI
jgi:VIT1/CCC1 family predicted Fe2+/Mn2+ transporter